MTKILIGTCGYGYKEWVGPVYPEGTKDREKLGLYSGLFPTVELDNTYYGMPKAAHLAKKLVDGGPDLTFSIKANDSLTHKIIPAEWVERAGAYREAIEPVLQAGRLEAVLFQFPYSFHYEDDNRRYLAKLLDFFRDVPSAVEFRGAEWFNNRVFDALAERGVSLVSLDMPELENLPPLTETVTAKTAYIRLHGRNKETWWGSDDATARFDYLYSDVELETWVNRIKRIVIQADRVLVYFNNHARGQAAQNGQMLIRILEKAGLLEGKAVENGDSSGNLPS